MAKVQVLDIVNDKVEIKNLSDSLDVFINYNKKYEKDYSLININTFFQDFLDDNGNFYVYDVDLSSTDDDIYIKVSSVYVENKDGCHICCKKYNVIVINKKLYYKSNFETLFNEHFNNIKSNKEYKKSELQTLSYEVRENQDRIMPKTCEYIDDTINNIKLEDVSKYHLTYEEISEYVKNNKKYIRDFIKENWRDLYVFKTIVGVTGCVSAIAAMYLLLADKYGLVLNAATYMYLFSTILYLSSQLAVERKMDSYVKLASKNKLVRKK